MNQVGDGLGIETKALLGDGGYETGAGLKIRVVEFLIALILLKVRSISGRQKCALMMVEPPGDFRGAGLFEIDDGIFLTIKVLLVKQSAGAMQQARENKLNVAANPFAIETREQRSGRSPIKAFVVIEHPNFQACLPFEPESDRLPEKEARMRNK
jgi:hypothetical protein